jgi:hypothetical protein
MSPRGYCHLAFQNNVGRRYRMCVVGIKGVWTVLPNVKAPKAFLAKFLAPFRLVHEMLIRRLFGRLPTLRFSTEGVVRLPDHTPIEVDLS